MKLLSFPALAGVCFAAVINPFNPLVCLDASPKRVSATTTTSATQPAPSSTRGWATTGGGLVTSYDYNDESSTVWVFPTGSGSHEANRVIFKGVQVIDISFVVVVVKVIDSQTMTVVSSNSRSTNISSTSIGSTSIRSIAASASTTKQPRATHLVNVGTSEKNAYDPSQLKASIGDTVLFNFLGGNHSVMQSDLASPCTYNGGFDTRLNQFSPLNTSGKFQVDFQVNVSTPLWFYYKQPGLPSHCGEGMVFAINPGNNFNQFQKIANAQGQASTVLTIILRAIGNMSSIS